MARTRRTFARGSKGLLFDIEATDEGNPGGHLTPFGSLTIEGTSSYFEKPYASIAPDVAEEVSEMWQREMLGELAIRGRVDRLPGIKVFTSGRVRLLDARNRASRLNLLAWFFTLQREDTGMLRGFVVYPRMTRLHVPANLANFVQTLSYADVFPGLIQKTGAVLTRTTFGMSMVMTSHLFRLIPLSLITNPALLVEIDKALEKGLA